MNYSISNIRLYPSCEKDFDSAFIVDFMITYFAILVNAPHELNGPKLQQFSSVFPRNNSFEKECSSRRKIRYMLCTQVKDVKYQKKTPTPKVDSGSLPRRKGGTGA